MAIRMENLNIRRLDTLMASAMHYARKHGIDKYADMLRHNYPAICHRLENMSDWEADRELERIERQMNKEMDKEMSNLASSIYGSSWGAAQQADNSTAAQQNAIMQKAMMQQMTTGTGLAQNMQNAYPPTGKEFVPDFGVLYTHNKELPADWAGAKITSYRRICTGTRWQVMFSSKWDKALTIELFLDIEELNGKDVNEMAATYMEALNQRRVG